MRRRTKSERDPVDIAFGNAVRAARKNRNWTIEDLGAAIGRPDGKYLGEIERGFHSPSVTTAKEIADALGLRLADLIANI